MSFGSLLRIIAIIGGLALLTSACGDDGDGSTEPSGDSRPADNGDIDEPVDRGPELTGTWSITSFQQAGATGLADVVGEPTISFDGTGIVSLNTACNTGDGEYSARSVYFVPDDDDDPAEGQPIDFGAISRTEIGCEGDLFDQDLAIPGAVRATDWFDLADGTLTLWRDGNIMIEATR